MGPTSSYGAPEPTPTPEPTLEDDIFRRVRRRIREEGLTPEGGTFEEPDYDPRNPPKHYRPLAASGRGIPEWMRYYDEDNPPAQHLDWPGQPEHYDLADYIGSGKYYYHEGEQDQEQEQPAPTPSATPNWRELVPVNRAEIDPENPPPLKPASVYDRQRYRGMESSPQIEDWYKSAVTSTGIFEIDGKQVILPTSIAGTPISKQDSLQFYRETGQHMGAFDNVRNALFYEQAFLQNQGAEF